MKQLVFEALNNAKANGHNYALTEDLLWVAEDMINCCSDFETVEAEDLIPHIEEWQKLNT